MDAHHLDFPDESFDLVFGRAILHHLDFETAIKEVKRVLKRGGHAAFAEPLGDSPFAKLFRLLTPRAYTPAVWVAVTVAPRNSACLAVPREPTR